MNPYYGERRDGIYPRGGAGLEGFDGSFRPEVMTTRMSGGGRGPGLVGLRSESGVTAKATIMYGTSPHLRSDHIRSDPIRYDSSPHLQLAHSRHGRCVFGGVGS